MYASKTLGLNSGTYNKDRYYTLAGTGRLCGGSAADFSGWTFWYKGRRFRGPFAGGNSKYRDVSSSGGSCNEWDVPRPYVQVDDAGPGYWATRIGGPYDTREDGIAACNSNPPCGAVVYVGQTMSLRSGGYTRPKYYTMAGDQASCGENAGGTFDGWITYYKGVQFKNPVASSAGWTTRTVVALRAPQQDACSASATPACDDGHQNQGELAADCGGPCAPCDCGAPPTDATRNYYDCGTAHGQTCNVACHTGYFGSPTASCTASGSWTIGGNCQKHCPRPGDRDTWTAVEKSGVLHFCPPLHGLTVSTWTSRVSGCTYPGAGLLPGKWWLGLSCADIRSRVAVCPDTSTIMRLVSDFAFLYDQCSYCHDYGTGGFPQTSANGRRCDDGNMRTRDDQCVDGACRGTPYACGFCERHDGERCVTLSQVNAGAECDSAAHSAQCTAMAESLMGCPKVSHRRPTATAHRVLQAVGVMGQCCYQCLHMDACKSWAFSVQTHECRLYTSSTAGALESSRNTFNWHTGQVSATSPDCAPYTGITACETSGLACQWVSGSCVPASDFRHQWKFIPATPDSALNYYDRENTRTLLAIGTKSSWADCRSWCDGYSDSGLTCLAWNWWELDQKCELLRTVRQWMQPVPAQQVYSGFKAFKKGSASLPYARAGVCKTGAGCKSYGDTDDSPAASPAHAAGDGMGCGVCNPLSSQSALSQLSYPKWCYVRSNVCDVDVACSIAEMTCGDNSADQYYRPHYVPCGLPTWDTATYPVSDLSPYATPWDFPDKGLWATWGKRWVLDTNRGLYYHTTWQGTPSRSNRVYACRRVVSCSGQSISCPPDPGFHAAACRDAMGICDTPEFCTGASDICPPDALVHSEFVCKPRVYNAFLAAPTSTQDPAALRAYASAQARLGYASPSPAYFAYSTLPKNLGKECLAACPESGPCSFCGAGKCCQKGDLSGRCLAEEGGADRHICVLGAWLDGGAWTATAKSSDGPTHTPANVLSGVSSFWVSSGQSAFPQWIKLAAPTVACVSGLRFRGTDMPVRRWSFTAASGATLAAGRNADGPTAEWTHEARFSWACDSTFVFNMIDAADSRSTVALALLELHGVAGPALGYLQTLNAALPGHDRESLTGTVSQCVAACEARSWCKSFDYVRATSRCGLQAAAAADVGGVKLDYPGHPYDYYEKPDLLHEDLCDIPQTCVPTDPGSPWECPQEVIPDVHFKRPDLTPGRVVLPAAFTGDYIEAQWVGHGVSCGLLWYAWGWGTSAGGFEASTGGALRGPTAEGSGHDWFTAFPGQTVALTRALRNPQDGQRFYVTAEVTNRDGRRSVADAVGCCITHGIASGNDTGASTV